MALKNVYALAIRTFGDFEEYTLVKNGMPQLCPHKSRVTVPNALKTGLNFIDQNCTDSCPLMKITEGNKRCKVVLYCGGTRVTHEFIQAESTAENVSPLQKV